MNLADEFNSLDLAPLRDPMPVTFWEQHGYWLIPLLVVLFIAALALAFWLGRRSRKTPPPTPYKLALRELEEAKALLESGTDKEYSSAVSNALRNYLERTYGLRAPEQTTEEFLEAAQSDPRLSGDPLERLGTFLQLCDLAKFAKHAFGLNERRELFNTAYDFIESSEQKNRKAPESSQPSKAST